MLLPQDKGPVAEWVFEDGPVTMLTWPTLERSLSFVARVVSILDSHGLLRADTVVLSQWMAAGTHDVARSERVEKPDVRIAIHHPEAFAEVLAACRAIVENEALYPLTIDVSGSGVLLTDQGESIVVGVARVLAMTLDKFTVAVSTQSDAWLPFSLSGQPQHRTFELNADRLEKALADIKRQTDFELEQGIASVYAVINGFRLDNIRYADGSIADVA